MNLPIKRNEFTVDKIPPPASRYSRGRSAAASGSARLTQVGSRPLLPFRCNFSLLFAFLCMKR